LELARRLVPADAVVAELLPGPRSAREPEGDGPNSPWFDWRRNRGAGLPDGEPESAAESTSDEVPDGAADEPSDGTPDSAAEAASVAAAAQDVRAFPWFG
jgi:hypothetical protein